MMEFDRTQKMIVLKHRRLCQFYVRDWRNYVMNFTEWLIGLLMLDCRAFVMSKVI